MRKIKFRAKRANGEWVFGRLIDTCYVLNENKSQAIIPLDNERIEHQCHAWIVIPETVGQFTGLTDKNAKEIYEGDIVRLTKIPAMDKLKFYADPFEIRYKENGCQFYGHRDGWLHDTYLYSLKEFEYEIIGNIHDNPELLTNKE